MLVPKQLKWEIGFRQNTQLAPRTQAEKCRLFHKVTLCSAPAPQPPVPTPTFSSLGLDVCSSLELEDQSLARCHVLLCSGAFPTLFGTARLWASSLMGEPSAILPNFCFLPTVCTEPCQWLERCGTYWADEDGIWERVREKMESLWGHLKYLLEMEPLLWAHLMSVAVFLETNSTITWLKKCIKSITISTFGIIPVYQKSAHSCSSLQQSHSGGLFSGMRAKYVSATHIS